MDASHVTVTVSDYKERKVHVLYDEDEEDEIEIFGVRLRGAQLHGGVHGRSRTWQAAVAAASRIQTTLQAMHIYDHEDTLMRKHHLSAKEASFVKCLKNEGAWTLQVVSARLDEVAVFPRNLSYHQERFDVRAHVLYVASVGDRNGSFLGERKGRGSLFGIKSSELNLRRCEPVVDARYNPYDEDVTILTLPGFDIRSASLLGALRASALGKRLPRDVLLMVAAKARRLEDDYYWDNCKSCVPDVDLTALGFDEVFSLLTDTDVAHVAPDQWY